MTSTTCSSAMVNTGETTNYIFNLNEQAPSFEDDLGYMSTGLEEIFSNTWAQQELKGMSPRMNS